LNISAKFTSHLKNVEYESRDKAGIFDIKKPEVKIS
jgi:hypothetical protein